MSSSKTSPGGIPRHVPAGRLDKRPNLTTVKNMLKKFFGGFVRVTGTDISDEYRRDIYTVGFLTSKD